MPEQIAVAFEVVVTVIEFYQSDNHVRETNRRKKRLRDGAMDRPSGWARQIFRIHLSRRQKPGWRRTPCLRGPQRERWFQPRIHSAAKHYTEFPTGCALSPVHCGLSRHVRVFLIDDIEIIRRTQQDPRHRIDGSWANRAEARKLRRNFGSIADYSCTIGGNADQKECRTWEIFQWAP